jgi:hypothetical protein
VKGESVKVKEQHSSREKRRHKIEQEKNEMAAAVRTRTVYPTLPKGSRPKKVQK